ncbi:predicted protein [Thalassiosira pseudonana CCMP1335]|uniref:Uncharacterized protein n=1 Tax=Thalassiosira pseudonana TaxID=35128 RepID=B8BSM2_THAPS|nr:predicted protein [Thalassiosira pseudonana CCMP1335]EED96152.1 predicted protein [Thalassiosira pseudonana CCMP1335]
MMGSPFNYEVDVYWILGCRWEEVLGEDANVWESYLQDQLLSNGVGLEVWEDAMPLDYEQTSLGPAGGNQRHLGEDAQSLDVQKQQKQKQPELVEQQRTESRQCRPSKVTSAIPKFMKQHRYVVRDKLQHYDVFLSFSASVSGEDGGDYGVLNRITGEHIREYLETTSGIAALRRGEKFSVGGMLIPALLSATVTPMKEQPSSNLGESKDDDARDDPQIDAIPCCKGLLPEDIGMQLNIVSGTKWDVYDTSATIDLYTTGVSSRRDIPLHSAEGRIVVEREDTPTNIAEKSHPFYEDGWILTKEQLIQINHNLCQGRFLPPLDELDVALAQYNTAKLKSRMLVDVESIELSTLILLDYRSN